MGPEFEKGDGRLRPSLQQRLPGAEGPPVGCSTAPRHASCGGPIRAIPSLLLKDSSVAVWSEGARVAPERPRAGRWVEGGHHAIGQATRGRSRGQRAALEGRAQTCGTCTGTGTWVPRVLVVRKAERAVRCGSKRDASAGRHGWRRQERRGWRGAAFGRRPAGD